MLFDSSVLASPLSCKLGTLTAAEFRVNSEESYAHDAGWSLWNGGSQVATGMHAIASSCMLPDPTRYCTLFFCSAKSLQHHTRTNRLLKDWKATSTLSGQLQCKPGHQSGRLLKLNPQNTENALFKCAYIHAYTHTWPCTYLHACMHACMHAYIHTYPYIHTHTWLLLQSDPDSWNPRWRDTRWRT